MKKYIIASIMALASAFTVSAYDYSLLVNTKDGNVVEYQFEFNPVATFDGDEMIIVDDYTGVDTRFNMADIINLTIKKPDSAVGKIETPHLTIGVTKDHLSVSGLDKGSCVNIYNLSGATVASAVAGEDGTVNIAVDGLGSGVFVASMPGNSFKFIR
ncbi:MAG: hypothetical protein HDR88_02005 [Bacteroides sp.]|nr:hypothetical protein [Bacteroides sp.]